MAHQHPLRLYREARDLTQEALGKELDVSGQTVWRWESGNRKIDRSLLSKVSERTNIPVRDLRPDLAELMGSE